MEGVDIPQIIHRLNKLSKASIAKSVDYLILDNDKFSLIRMTTGSGTDKTVTLPTAADNKDREISLIKADSGSNYAILDGEGAETIDYLGIQQTTITIELQGRGIVVKSNGTSWDVIEVIGAKIESIGGVLEMVYSKYFTGTKDNDSETQVTHGVDFDKITQCDGMIYNTAVFSYFIYGIVDTASVDNSYQLRIYSTYISFIVVGVNLRIKNYKTTIKYYI